MSVNIKLQNNYKKKKTITVTTLKGSNLLWLPNCLKLTKVRIIYSATSEVRNTIINNSQGILEIAYDNLA